MLEGTYRIPAQRSAAAVPRRTKEASGRATYMRAHKMLAFVRAAEEADLPIDRILAAAGLDRSVLKRRFVSTREAARVVEGIASTAPAEFGVEMGLDWSFLQFGLVGYALLTCRNYGEFCDRWELYSACFGNIIEARSVVTKDGWVYELRPKMPLSRRAFRMCVEEVCASIFPVWQKLAGISLNAVRLEVMHADPQRDISLERMLGVPVYSGAALDRLVVPYADRLRPIVIGDEDVLELCRLHCSEILPEFEDPNSPLHEIRDALLVSRGRPPLVDDMAATLGMSRRSLARHLARVGHSYRDVVSRYRCDYAMALLRTREFCVKEVAYTVGFNTPGSFRRTFVKWTGETLSGWSRRETGAPPPRNWKACALHYRIADAQPG